MATGRSAVLLAYRHLYQGLLRTVQYSKPARYVARDRLRAAFRNPDRRRFQPREIERTIEFLDGAAKFRGLEHQIVKNWIFVWWTRNPTGDLPQTLRNEDQALRKTAFVTFDETTRKLSETMGICVT